MRPYIEIPALTDVVLEESYVLKISAEPGSVALRAEFVVGPRHPEYHEPAPDESDCFVRGTLRFHHVRSVAREGQGAPPARDASGEIDYGHIDDLRWDGEFYELEGDWGRMRVVADGLDLVLES